MLQSSAFDYINVLDKAADASWLRESTIANNIANGICVALPAYLIMKIAAGKIKEIEPVMYVLVVVCMLYFYTIV